MSSKEVLKSAGVDQVSLPTVYFLHIPKTAGSTLGGWLRGLYPADQVIPGYQVMDLFQMSAEQINRYTCYSGHFGTSLFSVLVRPVKTFTFLRDPVERSISQLLYWSRTEPPAQAPRSFLEIYEVMQEHPDDMERWLDFEPVRQLIANAQTKELGRFIDVSQMIGKSDVDWQTWSESQFWSESQDGNALLQAAKRALDGMVAVGVVEQYDKSLKLITKLAGLPPPGDLADVKVNVTPGRATEGSTDKNWRDRYPKSVIGKIEELVSLDRELYNYARARLKSDLVVHFPVPAQAALVADKIPSKKALKKPTVRWDPFGIFGSLRFFQWWEYKVPILLGLYVEGVFASGSTLGSMAVSLVGLLILLTGIGSLAHVFNDWGDAPDDARSGQPNRFAGVSFKARIVWSLVLFSLIGIGLYLCKADVLVSGLTAASILTFAAYSFHPVRLKNRGGLGVFADVFAVHVLPTFLVLFLVRNHTGQWDMMKSIAAAIWLSSWGLRGILWHQLNDVKWDREAGVSTLAVRRSSSWIRKLCERFVFPVEVVAFLTYLSLTGLFVVWLVLPLYMFVEYSRSKLWQVHLIIIGSKRSFRLVLQEFYEVLLPLTLMACAMSQSWMSVAVLVIYLLLFQVRIREWFNDFKRVSAIWIQRCKEKTHG